MLDESFDVLRSFLLYLASVKGLSQNTIYGYYSDLKLFFRFMLRYRGLADPAVPFDEIDIKNIDREFLKSITLADLFEFLNFATTDRENHNRATARKASAIKGFFKYLHLQGVIPENIAVNLSKPNIGKSLPKYLSLDDCKRLLDCIDGPSAKRDYCMITLFINCGMRLSELVGINTSDIKHDQLLLRGKGDKERIIYLNSACTDAIIDYQLHKEVEFEGRTYDRRPLFLGRGGKRLGKRRVEDIVDHYLEKAELKHLGMSTHKLRHTAATLMYQNDTDVRILQEILGHSNLGTTQIYTHSSNEQIKKAMENNPAASIKKA